MLRYFNHLIFIIFINNIFYINGEELKQTNLLLIMFDDLRPEISVYGRKYVISPNFERLAARGVVFDHAYCQVAVCNPSRNSMLTGLRPDTIKSYNFGASFHPHMTFPTQLVNSGYNTAASGKIMHWVDGDKKIWSHDHFENNWYGYQGTEGRWMNASVMPDKKPESEFRDYEFTTRTIKQIREMYEKPNYFMAAIGYKLPHIEIHVPHKYYKMYDNKKEAWRLNKKELRFPSSVSEISHRCCADWHFKFVREEGSLPYNRSHPIMDSNDIDKPMPNEMHDNLMQGYLAGVSFLDTQVGRILDLLDELDLWQNTTVVLTSDHGMHNGEKGLWEKWTLFEESTRVPLIIAHPQSPFKGQHYSPPVESIDIYATLNELLKLPIPRISACIDGWVCKPLDGKSLAPVVLGKPVSSFDSSNNAVTLINRFIGLRKTQSNKNNKNIIKTNKNELQMLKLPRDFAISQVIRCAPIDRIPPKMMETLHNRTTKNNNDITSSSNGNEYQQHSSGISNMIPRKAVWNDCGNIHQHNPKEMSLLGYSMRTLEYRYTAYYPYPRNIGRPNITGIPYEEELYDHKNETLNDFTHREIQNLAYRTVYSNVIHNFRIKLNHFIYELYKKNSGNNPLFVM